ncbi:MAG: hypothetical protein N3D84_04025 [Candidatus Woesearchaeota archaeon]|nr:hypothetical protein [Candidatus Woesearchaeota archaeon]
MSGYKGSGNPHLCYAVNPGQSYYFGIRAEQQRQEAREEGDIENRIKDMGNKHVISDEEDISFFLLEKQLQMRKEREK